MGRLDTRLVHWSCFYNITEPRQFELAKLGYRVRVYVSYGVNWFPWLMRRLAERPANLFDVMRNVVHG